MGPDQNLAKNCTNFLSKAFFESSNIFRKVQKFEKKTYLNFGKDFFMIFTYILKQLYPNFSPNQHFFLQFLPIF